MPLIHVNQPIGQTTEQKSAIVAELTDAYVRATGAKPESVWITIEETSKDNWGIAGETLTTRAARAK
ncbi:tautomerase family protein [Amycolatopsis sp. H20-H5]|uniref:tautomerase family protein n=1 Tax=Amycolatopsis sp. H20-H5 TaxID=3046309 RepID=UPI002DBEDE5F|nr:4-oxalocrotonate tautomerase family protein [Amycolatopsis sp. H20-H5]MEC3980942.1 4-oxalocrotonate tautomerase family protein [Amycolatopsis sp. H20-H5]